MFWILCVARFTSPNEIDTDYYTDSKWYKILWFGTNRSMSLVPRSYFAHPLICASLLVLNVGDV